jgi:deoxyribodipyrimidine photo-lyase
MNALRLRRLKEKRTNINKKYVIYWMQQSQRVHFNHALAHAISEANLRNLPLIVYFVLTPTYPEANDRHYHFMLEGILEVKDLLKRLNIPFVLKIGSPIEKVKEVLKVANLFVMDYGYLKTPKQWRKAVLDYVEDFDDIDLDLVDSDLIVPVRVASDKAEYGAYTLRPKLKRLYLSFRDFNALPVYRGLYDCPFESDDDLSNLESLIASFPIDHSVKKSPIFEGGYTKASQILAQFLSETINHYPNSNDPSKEYTSKMSMYLHFGQISALEILERLLLHHDQGQINGEAFDAYLEQLLVRRELAFNYVTYQKGYDRFETMTEPWAYETMKKHDNDFKPYMYSLVEIETFKTHDAYFNAAMQEMVITGYMHNYMRMYWAKKIIEWSHHFKEAYENIIYLNNKYFIDGRDPNSYAGVAWCFGKHDRAWTEREIFGKLRYMNDKGLERKFDIDQYVEYANLLKLKYIKKT